MSDPTHDHQTDVSRAFQATARATDPEKRHLLIRMAEMVARKRLEAGLRDREAESADIQALISRVRNLGAELRRLERGDGDR